jgi:hypothetical protein
LNPRTRFVLWIARLLKVAPGELTPSASGLLMRCVPYLELRMSEHNDGFRLFGEVCRYLYDLGYTRWLDRVTDPRSRYAAGLSDDLTDNLDQDQGGGELPPSANGALRALYADLKDGRAESRILKARGMPLTACRADRVASGSPSVFAPIPQCHIPVDEAEPLFSNSIFGEAQ